MLNIDILKNPLNWVFVAISVMALILVLHAIFRDPSEVATNG